MSQKLRHKERGSTNHKERGGIIPFLDPQTLLPESREGLCVIYTFTIVTLQ